MTALEIDQELVRRPSVNPIHDSASTGEAEVVDWLALRTRDDWRGRVTVGCVVDEKTLTDLETYVRERVPEDDGLQVVFDPPAHNSPSFETAGAHPLVQNAYVLPGQAVAEVVPYGCDASKLAAAGIPSIIFGPGDIAQAHTKDEFIALTDLEDGTAPTRISR